MQKIFKKLLSNNTQLVHDFYFDRIIFASDVVNVKFLFNCINLSGARSIHSSIQSEYELGRRKRWQALWQAHVSQA